MTFLKKNNKGFTLVELIIAVAILGLVVGPLLSNFVTSARISMRSAEIGDATLAAENVFETFETEDWGTIKLGDPTNPISGTLVEDGLTLTEGDAKGVILPDYRKYAYEDVEIGYNTFDIDVMLNPGFYAEVGDSQSMVGDVSDTWSASEITAAKTEIEKIMDHDNYGELNNRKISYVTPMDYVFRESFDSNPTQDALDELIFEAAISDSEVEIDPILNTSISGSRTIDINVTELSGNGALDEEADTVKVEIVYTYELKHRNPLVSETTDITYTSDVISMTGADGVEVADGEKFSLYLLTYPWYYGEAPEDSIININNYANIELEFVIANQTPAIPDLTQQKFVDRGIATDNIYLQQCDAIFKGSLIRIKSGLDVEDAPPVTVLSNINNKVGTYTVDGISSVHGDALVKVQEFYNNKFYGYVQLGKLTDSSVTGSSENIVNQQSEPRIYEVIIQIKNSNNPSEVIHTMTGTILK